MTKTVGSRMIIVLLSRLLNSTKCMIDGSA